MSDSTALVVFDGTARLIIVKTGITFLDAKSNLYSEWKRWVVQQDNANWLPAFSTTGGDPVSPTLSVAPYFFLINGWRIRPFEGTHELIVEGNIYAEGGLESAFVPTVGAFNVSTRTQLTTNALQVSVGIGTTEEVQEAVWTADPAEYEPQDDTMGQLVTDIDANTSLIPGLF